jgi:hypothetical protein
MTCRSCNGGHQESWTGRIIYCPICRGTGTDETIRREIEEFTNTLSEKGIAEPYGLLRGPEESEEQLRERLRIYLLEYPRYEIETAQ